MKKISIVFGTRPELIKLVPLIKILKQNQTFITQLIFTGQHPDLIRPYFEEFGIYPDVSLNLQRLKGDLNELTGGINRELYRLSLQDDRPDVVVIHGDTATSFATAQFAFQFQIPIAHVEAGLRSHNLSSPFPEEFYRQSIAKMASLHFTPGQVEKYHLLAEGIDHRKIHVTGNTINDVVKISLSKVFDLSYKNQVLISLHRREGVKGIDHFLQMFGDLAQEFPETVFKFLGHPQNSENLKKQVSTRSNFQVAMPMQHKDFLREISESSLVVSDSGGAQEEAAILQVPMFIARDHTERDSGLGQNIKLVGTNLINIKSLIQNHLNNHKLDRTSPSLLQYSSGAADLISQHLQEFIMGDQYENFGDRRTS